MIDCTVTVVVWLERDGGASRGARCLLCRHYLSPFRLGGDSQSGVGPVSVWDRLTDVLLVSAWQRRCGFLDITLAPGESGSQARRGPWSHGTKEQKPSHANAPPGRYRVRPPRGAGR